MILYEYLHTRGLKYDFFADKLGISRSTLYGLINGYQKPSRILCKHIQNMTDGLVTEQECSKPYFERKEKGNKNE